MGGERFCRLASDFQRTSGNEDESHESCREGGGGHTLLFRSGIYATLLNSRQDYGSGHDQEEHAGNGPTLYPEPQTNSRTIVEAKVRFRWKHVEALGPIQTLFASPRPNGPSWKYLLNEASSSRENRIETGRKDRLVRGLSLSRFLLGCCWDVSSKGVSQK